MDHHHLPFPAAVEVEDKEGRRLRVREMRAEDVAGVDALLTGLSARSAYQRFLSVSARAGHIYSGSLLDPVRTLSAVVAECDGELVGVASSHPLPDGTAEFAIVVDDRHQGHGVGTLLLEELVQRARSHGISAFVGVTLGSNEKMLDVIRRTGLPARIVPEQGAVSVILGLREADE